MIKVIVELDVKGLGKKKRLLCVIVIANDGTGTAKYGNYAYALSHSGKYLGKRKEPFKEGRVLKFNRSHSPYELISLCLKDAGY